VQDSLEGVPAPALELPCPALALGQRSEGPWVPVRQVAVRQAAPWVAARQAVAPFALGPSGRQAEGPRSTGRNETNESKATSECEDEMSSNSISVRVCR
jgi:hypothetical protein